jgi:ATP-dependent DNA helicase RecG
LGYQQSGIKDFKIADPIHHASLFELAKLNIREIEHSEQNFNRYDLLLKLHDKADIINEINS